MSSSKALSVDQVKIWAETMGIQNLSEESAEFIVTSVNQKVLAIIDRANKSANASKRMKILKSDIDAAMQLLNLEPTVDNGVGDYIPIRGVSGVGGRTLYVQDDKDRDLHSVVKKNSGQFPAAVTLRQHWLAVEGKQPSVPENPAPLTQDEQRIKSSNPLVARKVATEKAIRKSQMISVKDLATSDLTAEQQQYYRDITEAVIGSNEEKRREALNSLEHDPGLHALVPRLAVFISEGVKINVVQQNLALLIYIMRMVKGMLDNQTLYLQPYLHLIVPAVTSCIVSRMLCVRPEADNHWALRGFASKILATLSKSCDSTTNRLNQRLIQMFKDALDDETTALATRFGAYSALTELGNDTITLMVIPRIKQEAEALRVCLATPSASPADKKSAEQIKDKLTTRIAEYCRQYKPSLDKLDDFRTDFGPIMGPAIHEQVMKDRKDPTKVQPVVRLPGRPAQSPPLGQPMSASASNIGSPRLPMSSPSSTGIASPNPYFPRPYVATTSVIRPSTPVAASPSHVLTFPETSSLSPSVIRPVSVPSGIPPAPPAQISSTPSPARNDSPVENPSFKREDFF